MNSTGCEARLQRRLVWRRCRRRCRSTSRAGFCRNCGLSADSVGSSSAAGGREEAVNGTAGLRKRLLPLIGQLSNRQFGQNLAPLSVPPQPPDRSDASHRTLCACGCGATVAPPRKFMEQEHYSAWLSQVRYFGSNRRSHPVDNHARGDCYRRSLRGAPPYSLFCR
jgi:hypothetical protein